MINVNSQRKEFAVVISDILRCYFNFEEDLLNWLNNSGFRYYYIVHDKDVNENGEHIRSHIHIVLTGLKRWRVKQLISGIADCVGCLEQNIQVEEVKNLTASIQYLIHKNDTNKYQYDYHSIVTNDNDGIVGILNETIVTDTITTDRLIQLIVYDGIEKIELIKTIGIGSYQHYRTAINDLYDIAYSRNR